MSTLADRLRGRRVGAVLSSAFFGFYGHTGFCRALSARGVQPVAWSGASAGAMVAAFGATRTLDRLPVLFDSLDRRAFWDPTRFVGRPPGLLRGHKLRDLLTRHLAPYTRFEQCPEQLITVATDITRGVRHVDTTGDIVPAVWASAALPIMFRPVPRHGGLHADGGIVDKMPIRALIETVDVDAVVAHLIPTRGLEAPLPGTPGRLIERFLDIARDDAWRHQVALAEARGIEVYVVTTRPGRVHPFALQRGPEVMRAAERLAGEVLDGPAPDAEARLRAG